MFFSIPLYAYGRILLWNKFIGTFLTAKSV